MSIWIIIALLASGFVNLVVAYTVTTGGVFNWFVFKIVPTITGAGALVAAAVLIAKNL